MRGYYRPQVSFDTGTSDKRNVLFPPADDPRPSFLDEYVAVTGNGGGGLDEYWEIFYKYPRSMGGAIWDFVSTGITEKVRLSKMHHLTMYR